MKIQNLPRKFSVKTKQLRASERKARPAPAPVQIQSSIFSSKQSSQTFQRNQKSSSKAKNCYKLHFFIVFAKMKEKKENVSFNC